LNECPVACSGTTSLPEIAGAAVLTFDPTSAKEMVQKLVIVSNDESARQELRHQARKRKPLFSSWIPAIKTIDIYRRVFETMHSE
jgi:glycosyltransferase involved in cell wall biosynthesis